MDLKKLIRMFDISFFILKTPSTIIFCLFVYIFTTKTYITQGQPKPVNKKLGVIFRGGWV